MAAPSLEPRCRFSSDPSSIVHNPYGCFGARGVPRPRGYPLSEVHRLSTCELEIRDGDAGSRIGVVQALASHDPDVDAIHGLSHPPGGLLLDHTVVPQGASGCQLRAVPAEAMTPYDAKVSRSTGGLHVMEVELRSSRGQTSLAPQGCAVNTSPTWSCDSITPCLIVCWKKLLRFASPVYSEWRCRG